MPDQTQGRPNAGMVRLAVHAVGSPWSRRVPFRSQTTRVRAGPAPGT